MPDPSTSTQSTKPSLPNRQFHIISGDRPWVRHTLNSWLISHAHLDTLYLGSRAPSCTRQLDIAQSKKVLGSECDIVIYDSFDGLDPDSLGIVAGAIRAGGALILLCPSLDNWADFVDPINLQSIPVGSEPKPQSTYVKRFIKLLTTQIDCTICQQHVETDTPLPVISTTCSANSTQDKPNHSYDEQRKAIEGIKRTLSPQMRKKPCVLIADRGRGKSAALGIAAGELISQGVKHIIICGHHKQSVASVLKHARIANSSSKAGKENSNASDDNKLHFMTVDHILRHRPDTELLMIDEAASVPLPLLSELLRHYPRIAFASTVHGYEGTGRGFLLKFQAMLDAHARGYSTYSMNQPIRWNSHDPLERDLSRLLLLDAAITTNLPADLDPYSLDFLEAEETTLYQNEPQLREIFALLVLAHYRTRPTDLRYLLDAPNIKTYALKKGAAVIAIGMIAIEGKLDDDLCTDIWLGKTRPMGHLLPQVLSAQQGLREAGKLTMARIIRIVVHPDYQRKGIGHRLIECLEHQFKNQIDIIGAGFSGEDQLLGFWQSNGFAAARIGLDASSYTAMPSCVVLKPLSEAGDHFCRSAFSLFLSQLPWQLASRLNNVPPQLIKRLYATIPIEPKVDREKLESLIPFAYGKANPDNLPGLLQWLCEAVLLSPLLSKEIPESLNHLAIERFLQLKPWAQCENLDGDQGKRHGVEKLREWARYALDRESVSRLFGSVEMINRNN